MTSPHVALRMWAIMHWVLIGYSFTNLATAETAAGLVSRNVRQPRPSHHAVPHPSRCTSVLPPRSQNPVRLNRKSVGSAMVMPRSWHIL